MATRLTISVPTGFLLPRVVGSYGYFLLPPNRWTPAKNHDGAPGGVLERPLRVDEQVVATRIDQPKVGDSLRVRCDRAVPRAQQGQIKSKVARMLRLDEDDGRFEKFHQLMPAAAEAKFDRLFRSPTLWEDLVKTITVCNVTFPQSITMNRLLCEHVGSDGAFPTPGEVAAAGEAFIKEKTKVGYRAERIVRLARGIIDGSVDLAAYADQTRATEAVFKDLKKLYGFGDFAASNMLMLLGRYDRLATDSETVRFFRQRHGVEGGLAEATEAAERHYEKYDPFQFLAYWFELWKHYESVHGPAWTWPPRDMPELTGRKLSEALETAGAAKE